jgi:hypothetical protein
MAGDVQQSSDRCLSPESDGKLLKQKSCDMYTRDKESVRIRESCRDKRLLFSEGRPCIVYPRSRLMVVVRGMLRSGVTSFPLQCPMAGVIFSSEARKAFIGGFQALWADNGRYASLTNMHTAPGSRAGLLPSSPLRTTRASFPACRSSLPNAPYRTRLCHVERLAVDLPVTVGMQELGQC